MVFFVLLMLNGRDGFKSMDRKLDDRCPCCGQMFPAIGFLLDDFYRVVIRDGKVAPLSIAQFAVFAVLHRRRRSLTMEEIVTEVYRGAEMPLTARSSVHVIIREMNKKLIRLGLKVVSSHPGRNAFWRIRQSAIVGGVEVAEEQSCIQTKPKEFAATTPSCGG